jgi:tetratricopeptide (TPR) repeat protein
MSWWSRLLGGRSDSELKPQRVDYLNEALALERQGDYEAALTSYRLAYRDNPHDTKVLQNMAIACTKLNRVDEAIRYYRKALAISPTVSHTSCSNAATRRARRRTSIRFSPPRPPDLTRRASSPMHGRR